MSSPRYKPYIMHRISNLTVPEWLQSINFSTSQFSRIYTPNAERIGIFAFLWGRDLMSNVHVMMLLCPDGLLFIDKTFVAYLGLIDIVIEIW